MRMDDVRGAFSDRQVMLLSPWDSEKYVTGLNGADLSLQICPGNARQQSINLCVAQTISRWVLSLNADRIEANKYKSHAVESYAGISSM